MLSRRVEGYCSPVLNAQKKAGEARPFWDKGLSGSGLTHELHGHLRQGVGLGQQGVCALGTGFYCAALFTSSVNFSRDWVLIPQQK